jgi:cation:H+ antiporter
MDSAAIGIFLVSMGTAAPDLMSVIMATLEGHPDFSMGNILGSNFSNLTLGFGIASLIAPFKCTKKITKVEIPLLFALTIFFVICCFDGQLTRFEGIAFLLVFAAYLIFSFFRKGSRLISSEREAKKKKFKSWRIWQSASVFIFSAALLACGAHLVVTRCIGIADAFGMSQTFIGFSLSALGTSAPEIFVVATAAKRRHYSICSGNIIGSNLINLTLVAGLCSAVHPIHCRANDLFPEACSLIFVTALSWYIFVQRKIFSRGLGLAFIAIYFVTMFLLRK